MQVVFLNKPVSSRESKRRGRNGHKSQCEKICATLN